MTICRFKSPVRVPHLSLDEIYGLVEIFKVGEELFSTGQNQQDFTQMEEGTFQIVQGALEKSNVDMTEQLTNMIKSQRNFQSCAEVLRIYDSINELSANQIGKL